MQRAFLGSVFGALFVGRDREGAEPEVEVSGAAGSVLLRLLWPGAADHVSENFPDELVVDGEAALRAPFQLCSDGAHGAFCWRCEQPFRSASHRRWEQPVSHADCEVDTQQARL